MEFDYEIMPSDIELAQARASLQLRETLRQDLILRAIVGGMMIAVLLLVGSVVQMSYRLTGRFLTGSVWPVLWLVVAIASLFAFERVHTRKSKAIRFGRFEPFPIAVHLEMTQDGLELSDRFGRDFYPWSLFSEVSVLPAHLALTFDPMRIVVVPLAAFSDSSQRTAFESDLRARVGS